MFAIDFRSSKRLRAALTLAALYAAGVLLLFLAVFIMKSTPRDVLRTLPVLGIPTAICFASAFILLAVARRAGFTALWILVFGLWVVSVYPDFSLFRANLNFLSWSLLAAPLYTMVSLGFRRPPSAGWRRWLRMAIPVTWAALGAIAIGFDDLSLQYFLRQPSPILLFWRAMSIAWAVAPPAVTVASILWIYDGTVEATSI